MGIGTRAHRIIAIIQISIVTIRIMHAISILYSSLCSLNAAIRTMALCLFLSITMKVHVLTALGHFLSGIWEHPHVCGEMSKNIESPRDHPHVCGEKDALGMTFPAATPTCVGKSTCHTVSWFLRWDHPHVCGEKT